MYTQESHNPQPGQGPKNPMPSLHQHRLPGPPAIPHVQQGPSGFTSYQHGPSASHQIPPGGLSNTGQSYLQPPVHVHGGAPLLHIHPTAQQNSQHNSHLRTQNAHNMPQSVLPPPLSASHPEVSQTHPYPGTIPPVPPPLHSQGQTLHRAPVNPSVNPLPQHVSSLPPVPSTTSFFPSAPRGNFVHSASGGRHVLSSTAPLPAPPLAPSSTMPILPSVPSTSSTPFSASKPAQNASGLPCNLDIDDSKLNVSSSVAGVVAPNQVKHNLISDIGSLNKVGRNGYELVSLVGSKLSIQEGLTTNLSSPPPKPSDKIVVQRIEALCECIATNGPDYEDMVRKNESGKPDYAFLYGGEPGTDAATAHDFFQWMKKKCILARKVDGQLVNSSLRPSETEPPEQPCDSVIVAAYHSADDSDMEMEDDITQIDDEQAMDQSLKALNSQCDTNDKVLHAEEQFHPLQISAECNAYKEEKEPAAGNMTLGEQGSEGITNAYQVKSSTLSTEQPLVNTLEKSNISSQSLKGGSPFRLLRGYASDDNSEKDVETCVGNTSVSFGEHIGNKNINHASSLEVLQKENIMSGKEHSQEKNETPGSSQHKIDKFGRLVKNVDSDSDSDDSCHVGRHRRGRTRSRSRSFSPLDRRRRSPLKRKEKRSRSRSWSPRKRRSRSRSPRSRRSRSRSPRNHRSRSRSPRNRRSRSRSPRNRRSRSRSPRNHRSRSRSPRNRWSRSRSPSFRRVGGFSSENKRRVKGQMQDCFDFRRGRCYRGASCRYLHHGSGKIDESRWQRNKQQNLEFSLSSKTNVREEIKRISEKEADLEHGVRGPEVKLFKNFVTSTDMNIDQNSVGGDAHNQDSQSTQYQKVRSENSRDIPPSLFETHSFDITQERPNPVTNEQFQEAAESHQPSILDTSLVGNMDTLNSFDNASQKIHTSSKNSVDQKSFSSPLDPVCQNANFLPQQSDNSSISNYSLHKPFTSSSSRLLERSANQNTMYSHNHPSHVPSHSLPHSQGLDNLHMKDQQTGSSVFQSSGESFPSSVFPNQLPHFAPQLNPSLASLPPPPSVVPHGSTVNAGNGTPAVSSHFPLSHLPPRNDSGSQIVPRPYPTELPLQSQSNGFQQQPYLQIQEANRPILHASLPVYNLPIQQCGAPSMSRDDGFKQPPMQNVIASNSFAEGNTQPHAMPFSHQMLGNKMQPLPCESLPPGGFSSTSSCMNSYSQQQQPPHNLHSPMVDSNYTLNEKVKSSLKDPPDIRDTTSNCVVIGGSTGSTYPNPYASTVDQPQNSKYSCNVRRQDKDTTYDKSPFSLTCIPVDGRGNTSQQATSSPSSARAIGQSFPLSGGDQYDPILDSIEPSSRSSRKVDYTRKMEVTGDSDMLLGISGTNKPVDMEEDNKRKDGEAVASAASADNEEFGETADTEVGAVENGSPSNPVATGEIEIDQIKSPGKSRKDKDSRSMKLFKVALADFVKEVLKPSWRQGNMSKEAFKTIVKKTVDKVSGAMKSHQIPKSRAKIDQYIESSQRKLTKLVMGYVDKYVNV